MYQVCIVSNGSEIGYGEGYSLRDARDEAAQSLDTMGQAMLTAFGGVAEILDAAGNRTSEKIEIR